MEKEHINIVTIGALDSGKSTLVGHLIYKLGGIEKRTIEEFEEEASKIGKASFKYAWIMDKLKSERERGVTITVSNWKIETNKFHFTIFDTPGHPSYLKNTLSGICLADTAIVVVNAEIGAFEKSISKEGNLRRDLLISTFGLGIKQIIVAVNKIDLVKFSEERFNEIKDELLVFLKKAGFEENQINFIPISGFFGDNLIEKSENLSWFKGNTMFEALDSLILPKRPIDKPLRMNISNVYKIGGIGTVITGRVLSGIIKVGMKVDIKPNNLHSEVNSIEMHHESIPQGIPGDFIGINVKNISVNHLKGSAIISDSENNPAKRCENFTAQIIPLRNFGKRKIGSKVMIFLAGQYIECKIKEIQLIDGERYDNPNPTEVKYDKRIPYVIIFEPLKPMVVEKVSEFPDLGRFVIIDSKRVIGIGRINEFKIT